MVSRKARHKARTFAIQALYQWQYNPTNEAALIAEFQARNDYHTYVDWDLFADLVKGALADLTAIDAAITQKAGRPLKEINPTELAILRIASAELKERFDVPYQVVLSEYVDLAEEFGATDAHQFINAVLDRLSKDYRPLEQGAQNALRKTEKTQADPLTDL